VKRVLALAVLASLAFAGVQGVVGGGPAGAVIPPPVGADGVIGAEWNGVTPTMVPLGPADPNGQLVAFKVFVRSDANYLYVGVQAVPAPGDSWDDAVTLSLGGSANVYLDTDHVDGSDVLLLPLDVPPDYCQADGSTCSTNVGPPPGPHSVYTAATEGLKTTDPGGPVGGVREFAVPWTVLQTDPDSLGFPKAVCDTTVRSVQGFGYNFSGPQFDPQRFGTVAQPGCGTTPTTSATPTNVLGQTAAQVITPKFTG
jgi:hypothetical protein